MFDASYVSDSFALRKEARGALRHGWLVFARRVVVVGLVLTPLLAGVAYGAAWITPRDVGLSAGGITFAPQPDSVAMSPAGNLVVGWVTYNSSATTATVHLVRRPAGGPAPAEQTYTEAVGGLADLRLHLSVAVNDAGDAIAVWDLGGVLSYVVGTGGSAFGSAQQTPVFQFQSRADDPAVALAQDGTATLVYGAFCGDGRSDNSEAVAITLPRGGTPTDWSSPDGMATTFPQSCGTGKPSFVDFRIDELPDGTAIVGFREDVPTAPPTAVRVYSATRTSATGLFTTQLLASPSTPDSPNDPPDMPAVAIEPGGASLTAWSDSNGVEFSYHPRTGSDVTGGAGVATATTPQVAMGFGGEALVVYADTSSNPPGAFQVAPSGSVQGGQTFPATATGELVKPQVVADARGDAVAIYRNTNNNNNDGIEALVRSPGGAFGAPTKLGSPSSAIFADHPVLASDALGDAAAFWMMVDTSNAQAVTPVLQGYDGVPPHLTSVSVPSTLARGQTGAFSLSASDVWGPVSAGWSFGDGGMASGFSAQHAFISPGRMSVTAIATDAAGNVSRELATTLVAGPAAQLSGLSISPHKFELTGRKLTGKCVTPTKKNKVKPHCKRPIKLMISYTLSAASTVTFTLKSMTPGRKVNGKCVKQTMHNAKKKHCTRQTSVPGQVTQTGTAGANNFTFDGRIGGKTLGIGTYKLSASGTGGQPQSATFAIVR